MAEPGVEPLPELEDDTQVEADGLTLPKSEEETAHKDESGGEAEGDQQQLEEEDDNFGMLVLAGENQESDLDEGSVNPFDVVAVHGLYGDREDSWTTDKTDDALPSNWLRDKIYERCPSSRILTFGYDASATKAGISTRAGIRKKALQLLDDLVELRKSSNPDTVRPLVFIAHDLGGIIVKEALWIASFESRKYRSIANWARLLIFFGCPHRCVNSQDMEDKIANLLFTNKNPRPVGVTRTIKELGRSIIEINGSFAVSNIPSLLNIVNVYSEEGDAALQVFDKYMATMDILVEERIGCSKSHKDLCKFAESDDLYERIDQTLGYDPSAFRRYFESVKCLQTLRSVATPVYPLKSLYGPTHQFNWISTHQSYRKWLDDYGPSILHVHGSTGASDASEYIFQCLDVYQAENKKNEILVYFSFNAHDDRCNSIAAMINSFLAQILIHHDYVYNAVRIPYERMSLHHSWAQADLLHLFRMIVSDWNHGGVLYVINGLDECDNSRTVFLKDLCRFASVTERRYKIAITSKTDSDLQALLANWPTINLDDHPEDLDTVNTNLAANFEREVLELMQHRPVFCDFEKTVTDKLLRCGHNKHWRRLISSQLRLGKSLSTKSATQRELDLLPPTPSKDVFARILARVPSEKQAWARKALVWILYTFRPLSIWELGVAIALEVDSLSDETMDLDELVYQDVIAELDEVFGGMLIVEHNEVHFTHPDGRQFLLAADGEQEHVWYDVKETAHQEITDACQLHLSLQQVQDSIAMSYGDPPDDPREWPTFVSRYSLRDYVIRYWPRHYKIIPETLRPTQRTLKFVRYTKAMRSWAEAYWWASNSLSRTTRAYLSSLPVFAGLGLQDLVTEWLRVEAQTPESSQDRALALAEAARNAHVEVVRRLLSCGEYNQASLQDALVAGACCCDEAVLDELITYAAESIENFEWPSVVLCQAAQFGLVNAVKKLLEFGASIETAMTLGEMGPLHLAARHGHAEVVEVLLRHKASLTKLSKDYNPLHFASMDGDPTIVKLLLDAGAEVNAVDAEKHNALYFACLRGNYKAVEILAEAGCDINCVNEGDWSPLIIAANEGYIESARLLLKKKANTEIKGWENWTPLRYAALKGHVDLCRLLLENGADGNTLGGGAPILAESASKKNLKIIELLVENGAVVDAVNAEGWTALQKASMAGHTDIVTYLLDHGANINHTNVFGHTSILLAAQSGFAKLVQLLIDRGADLHRATTDNWTPIHLSYNHLETTRVLMENGADANRIANDYTPLYLAASENQIEVVKVLLSFDPDLEIRYQTGYTVLGIATLRGYTKVVRLLLEAGANVNQQFDHNNFALQWPVTYNTCNTEDILHTLMEYHPDLNLVDDDGDSALHCINFSTTLAVVKLLVNGGSDLETRNYKRMTPLCRAVMVENIEIVKYLIAKKAELNIIGGKYGGPLHIACHLLNLELVKILVEAGANVNLVDPASAGTPIQSACDCWSWRGENVMQESIICYLIDVAKADVTIVGGLQGCALNAACGRSTPQMVELILKKGAKINVEDEMGRVAIHFAAVRSVEHFHPILDAGADIEVRDKMGRTALHWAIIGGKIDVVRRVLSLSRDLVNEADIDSWTPLLWAARWFRSEFKPVTFNAQEEIINFLLDQGANPCVRGKGLDREWSPLKVARYHGVDDAVIQLLTAKAKEKLAAEGEEDTWDEAFHASKRAQRGTAICDSCLSDTDGIRYKCETCLDFDFCYKCYLSRHIIHPDHPFKTIGLEYEPESDEQEDDTEDDDNTTDDDTEDDDTDDNDVDDNNIDNNNSGNDEESE